MLPALLLCSVSLYAQQSHPGSRTVMDAHNCYPYFEWWGDRNVDYLASDQYELVAKEIQQTTQTK
jgi:hypothetical protein